MTDQRFVIEARQWIESGPTLLPAGAFDVLVAAVATTPQDQSLIDLLSLRRRSPRLRMAVAAAAVVAAVGLTGLVITRTPTPQVATQPDVLLRDVPGVTQILLRSGEPDVVAQRIELGALESDRAFVVAVSCVGRSSVTAGIVSRPDGYHTIPLRSMYAACDGAIHRVEVSTMGFSADSLSVHLDVPVGTSWSVAIGEAHAQGAPPAFPAVTSTNGFHVISDDRCPGCPPVLIAKGAPESVGYPALPNGVTQIALIVSCSGSPLTVSRDSAGSQPTSLACDDPAAVSRIAMSAVGVPTFSARSEGLTWVHIVIEADGEMTSVLPAAPAMPPEIAATGFAENDGLHLVFGSLGSNTQTLVDYRPGISFSQVPVPGGDVVLVAGASPSGETRLDLWSIREAAFVRTLVTLAPGDQLTGSWVDPTHQQAFYERKATDLSLEWRRVGLDGSGDTVVAAAPVQEPGVQVVTRAALAVDDSVFLIDRCQRANDCTRVIYDAATGTARTASLEGDEICELIGAVAGRVVVRSGAECASDGPHDLLMQRLDGRPDQVLVQAVDTRRWALGVIIPGTAGPLLIYALYDGSITRFHAVPLAGGDVRDLGSMDLSITGGPILPSAIRLPLADWVLLSGRLGDTPLVTELSVAPRLVNVATGETIELVNLPHATP